MKQVYFERLDKQKAKDVENEKAAEEVKADAPAEENVG